MRRPPQTRNGNHAKAQPLPVGRQSRNPTAARCAGSAGRRGYLGRGRAGRALDLPCSAPRAAFRLARRPGTVARRLGSLGVELGATVAGFSSRAPSPKDWRFADPAWRHSWLFRRIAQGYLAGLATAEQLIGDAELDWAAEEELRFVVENIADALAPTNFLWSNPTALKLTIDYGAPSSWLGRGTGCGTWLRRLASLPVWTLRSSRWARIWRQRQGRLCIEARSSS